MPFKHINRQELRESITKHNHDELPDDIPNEIKELISNCFKKEPKKHYVVLQHRKHYNDANCRIIL